MAAKKSKPKTHTICIIRGVEGLAVYINDYRVVGSKPWGGGETLAEWTCTDEDFEGAGLRRDAK